MCTPSLSQNRNLQRVCTRMLERGLYVLEQAIYVLERKPAHQILLSSVGVLVQGIIQLPHASYKAWSKTHIVYLLALLKAPIALFKALFMNSRAPIFCCSITMAHQRSFFIASLKPHHNWTQHPYTLIIAHNMVCLGLSHLSIHHLALALTPLSF